MLNRKHTYIAIVAALGLGADVVVARESYELKLSHINGLNGFRIKGFGEPADRVNVGWFIRPLGDINGDQIDDLMVGTKTSANYVILGESVAIPHPFDLTTTNGNNGFLIQSQSGIENLSVSYEVFGGVGDVNNDGINDFSGLNRFNDARVVFGQADFSSGLVDLDQVSHPAAIQVYRSSSVLRRPYIKHVGDIDGDGINDFSVSDSDYGRIDYDCDKYYPSGAYSYKGASYLIFGTDEPTPSVIDLDQIDQSIPANVVRIVGQGNSIGEQVYQASALGDVNGDGIDDLAVSSSGSCVCNCYYRSNSETYVVFGKRDPGDFPSTTSGLSQDQGFRLSTRAPRNSSNGKIYPLTVGDINHDGVDDIGYCFRNNPSVDVQRCGVVFGGPGLGAGDGNRPDGTNGFEVELDERSARLQLSVTGFKPGDFNGDGIDDLFLNFSGNYCGTTCQPPSSAMIFWGSDQPFQSVYNYDQLTASQHVKILPLNNSISQVSAAGDINHDGLNDLLIGLPNGFQELGSAYVIYGFTDLILSGDFD